MKSQKNKLPTPFSGKNLKILFFIAIAFAMSAMQVAARPAFDTVIFTHDGRVIQTQQAYDAVTSITAPEIRSPEDLFIDSDGYMYVADSASRLVVVLDHARNVARLIGEGYLTRPTGVAVNDSGEIFVADSNSVFKFDAQGVLLNEFTRPNDPLFGQASPFAPRKVALDARGNIFIAGEAAVSGIIQLDADGNFISYVGANDVNLTLFQILQNIFTPRDQRQFLAVPAPPTNLTIDSRGAVYTITAGLNHDRIKRFNVAGENILNDIPSSMNATAITMANHGGFFVIDTNGMIIEYTAEGDILFIFGGSGPATQRLGVFRQPTGIAQDANGNLYVSDSVAGLIHVFMPTEFAQWVFLALEYFELGMYTESMAYWQEVLRFHSAFSLANLATGHALFLDGDYTAARNSFFLARYVQGYSDSFWEIRNEWLYNNAWILFLGAVLLIVFFKCKNFAKRKGYIKAGGTWTAKYPIIQELLHVKKVFINPADAFYEIRFYRRATVRSAVVLYVLFFFVFMFAMFVTGFIFSTTMFLSVPMTMTVFTGAVGLFVTVNYLVATVNEGEGSFRDVFVSTAYAVSPFILFGIPITLLTQILTLNEAFVYHFLLWASVAWSAILLFIMIKEIHDYIIRDTIKNILLTVFTSIVIVVVVFVIYLLINQVIGFFGDFFVEVGTRVN